MMDENDFDYVGKLGDESIEDMLSKAHIHNQARLATDPEWTTPKAMHFGTVIQGFAQGILSADPWYTGYQVPEQLVTVLNHMATRLQADPPTVDPDSLRHSCLKVSLLDLEAWYRKHAHECPEFLELNEYSGTDGMFVTRDSPTPTHRTFIDLGAAIRNAVVHIRDEIRRDEEFDRKFAEEWAKRQEKE